MRAIFDHARKHSPCILVLEDLDAMVTDNVRSFFLNELDGLVRVMFYGRIDRIITSFSRLKMMAS